MHAALSAAILFFSAPLAALPSPPIVEQTVEQSVELVAVHHLADGAKLVGFFDLVQGEWTLLSHRHGFTPGPIVWAGDCWLYEFHDEEDGCYRLIRARCWAECWCDESPFDGDAGRPWFVGLLEPGLKSPQRAD